MEGRERESLDALMETADLRAHNLTVEALRFIRDDIRRSKHRRSDIDVGRDSLKTDTNVGQEDLKNDIDVGAEGLRTDIDSEEVGLRTVSFGKENTCTCAPATGQVATEDEGEQQTVAISVADHAVDQVSDREHFEPTIDSHGTQRRTGIPVGGGGSGRMATERGSTVSADADGLDSIVSSDSRQNTDETAGGDLERHVRGQKEFQAATAEQLSGVEVRPGMGGAHRRVESDQAQRRGTHQRTRFVDSGVRAKAKGVRVDSAGGQNIRHENGMFKSACGARGGVGEGGGGGGGGGRMGGGGGGLVAPGSYAAMAKARASLKLTLEGNAKKAFGRAGRGPGRGEGEGSGARRHAGYEDGSKSRRDDGVMHRRDDGGMHRQSDEATHRRICTLSHTTGADIVDGEAGPLSAVGSCEDDDDDAFGSHLSSGAADEEEAKALRPICQGSAREGSGRDDEREDIDDGGLELASERGVERKAEGACADVSWQWNAAGPQGVSVSVSVSVSGGSAVDHPVGGLGLEGGGEEGEKGGEERGIIGGGGGGGITWRNTAESGAEPTKLSVPDSKLAPRLEEATEEEEHDQLGGPSLIIPARYLATRGHTIHEPSCDGGDDESEPRAFHPTPFMSPVSGTCFGGQQSQWHAGGDGAGGALSLSAVLRDAEELLIREAGDKLFVEADEGQFLEASGIEDDSLDGSMLMRREARGQAEVAGDCRGVSGREGGRQEMDVKGGGAMEWKGECGAKGDIEGASGDDGQSKGLNVEDESGALFKREVNAAVLKAYRVALKPRNDGGRAGGKARASFVDVERFWASKGW